MQNSFKQPTVVPHPETGNVITPNPDKPEFGTLRLDQIINTFNGRFFSPSKRTVFIGGRIEDFKTLGLKAGQTMPGKIIKVESFEPFYEGQTPKINPTTQEVVTLAGKPVFLQFEYSEDPNTLDIAPNTAMATQEAPKEMVKGDPNKVF